MIPGVLLTGGASRRLGRDKATLLFRGEPLAARAARVLRAVCDPVIEVGPGVSGLGAIREDPPGAGPLAALFAGVAALEVAGPVIVLACDLPFVEIELLATLARWPGTGSVVPVVDGYPQLACARWSADAIAQARKDRATALKQLLDGQEARCTPEELGAPADVFRDIDTPDDLASLDL